MATRSQPNVPDAPTPPERRRRTGRQRVVLGFGIIVTTLAIAVAAVAGWATWKYLSIDRANVELDEATGGPRNYLIVGSDSRAGGDPDNPGQEAEQRAPLADTIMIVRVDPSQRSAKVLSLPRDLWVDLPNGKEGRINSAYSSGPQGLIDTLRRELDIPIHHYIEVNFQAFEQVVGAIDGVPMWFDQPMRDRNSGLDVTESGCIQLDGTQALGFARARHLQVLNPETGRYRYDGTGDLGRITRQQAFLRRVIDRSTSKAKGNPVVLQKVVNAGVDNVTLDQSLGLSDLTALARRFQDFGGDQLITLTVPVTPRTTSGGAAVLDLDRAGAEPILAQFRDPVPETSTTSTTTVVDPASVQVAVYNSSGIAGLATETSQDLANQGFTVIATGNGSDHGHASEDHTLIRYAEGDEEGAALLATKLAVTDVAVDPTITSGVSVYLGADHGAETNEASSTTSTSVATSSSTPAVTTTTIASSEPIGVTAGDPPPGITCG